MDATNAEQKMNNMVDGVWLHMMKVGLRVVKKMEEGIVHDPNSSGSFHIEKGRIRGWNFVEDWVLCSGFFIIKVSFLT